MSLAFLSAQSRRLFCVSLVLGFVAVNTHQGVRADYVVSDFNSADEAAAWFYETWSSAPSTASWDPTVDSSDNPASGSLKIEIDFDAAGLKEKGDFTYIFPTPFDATPAYLFIADVRVAEESPDTPWLDDGYLDIVARTGDNWDWTPQHSGNLSSRGAWVNLDITPTGAINDIRALTLQLWGGGGQALQGKTTLWLDNIQFLGEFPDPDPTQLGDTDGDLDVDITDLNNVRNNFSGEGLGDTDGDLDVDITDLNNVRNNFGAGAPVGVPEPTSAVLVLCGLGGVLLARRRLLRG
ncbi:MAG: PEP-CTERM sorting domain-containing protein [Planctomycetia bacterium]|nr:PEP-CTERM sorting domain-containing protein [Planctomycetia bacterium]